MDDAVEKLGPHKPAGPLRGNKSSVYEGGTRVPFIVRWPQRVPAGATSDALICQIDFLASLAALTNQKLPNGPPLPPGEGRVARNSPWRGEGDLARLDSVNVLPALLGESKAGRDELATQARDIALRKGQWKYIEPRGRQEKPQLYNLADDLAEQHNLAKQNPQKVKELAADLARIRKSGRMP
jgi:arylsulfatase A-like enzyme